MLKKILGAFLLGFLLSRMVGCAHYYSEHRGENRAFYAEETVTPLNRNVEVRSRAIAGSTDRCFERRMRQAGVPMANPYPIAGRNPNIDDESTCANREFGQQQPTLVPPPPPVYPIMGYGGFGQMGQMGPYWNPVAQPVSR